MVNIAPAEMIRFTDEALARIVAGLPPDAPPERVALLPEILRAWTEEDLREHLSREGRAVIQRRTKQLATVSKRANGLIEAVRALDGRGRFIIACEAQMRREATIGNPRSGGLWGPDDIEGAKRRRDEALSWLCDLVTALGEPRPKPPPDKKTVSYLVVLDLAAIFELVTCTQPTRRNNPYSDSSQAYGPFWDFVNCVCSSFTGVGSIDRAIRDLMTFYPTKEYSAFVANLQFRHPGLWQKLRRVGQ